MAMMVGKASGEGADEGGDGDDDEREGREGGREDEDEDEDEDKRKPSSKGGKFAVPFEGVWPVSFMIQDSPPEDENSIEDEKGMLRKSRKTAVSW
ncbi:hypothetical protein TWF569_010170 [Orbilia oligospora]|nr:hypothetical protein TWF569_010170 [Orbilia oligospora]